MADEAVMRVRFSDPVDFTCADGTAIPKGTLLSVADGRVAAIASANDFVCGVCGRDKIANDGRLTVPVFMDGIFDMTCTAATVAVGVAVAAGGANEVKEAVATDVGLKTVGLALEEAAVNEVIQVLLRPGCNNTAYV